MRHFDALYLILSFFFLTSEYENSVDIFLLNVYITFK